MRKKADMEHFCSVTRNAEVFSNVYDACDEADAIVIATEWDMFSNREVEKATNQITLADVLLGQMVATTNLKALNEAKTPSEKTSSNNLAGEPKASPLGPASGGHLELTPPSKKANPYGMANPKAGNHLDWEWVARRMKKPRFVFDGRNILDAEKLRQLGFIVESIGKAPSDFHLRRDF